MARHAADQECRRRCARRWCGLLVPALALTLSWPGAASVSASRSDPSFRCPPLPAPGYCGDGGSALRAGLGGPTDVTALAGGGYLVADAVDDVVRLVRDGRITTVAGGGTAGGRSGLARNALLSFPAGVAELRGGGFAIADTANDRVLMVKPDGHFRTIAGSGRQGDGGDGGPAAQAELHAPMAVAQDAQGELLIADTGNGRVRVVRGDGTIATVLAFAQGDAPTDVSAMPEGGFVVATEDGRVLRVGPGGTVATLAVEPHGGSLGVAALPGGGMLISDGALERVTRVNPDGTEQTLASGTACGRRRSLPTGFGYPVGVDIAAGGDVLVADVGAARVFRISGQRVLTDAGGGLEVPPGGCSPRMAPRRLLEYVPPGPNSVDAGYFPTQPSACASPAEARFRLRFAYIKQRGRVQRQPRAGRPFAAFFYVSAPVQVVMTVSRSGHVKVRVPRRGTLPRQGRFQFGLPGLRSGRYRLRLVANSSRYRQKLCASRTLSVRR